MEKIKRKEREFNTRRAEILDQAEKIFSSKGFHSTTVAEIAGAAGFAVGSLYHFFESKEQLFTVMIREKFERMLSEVESAVNTQKGVREKIAALIKTHFQLAESNSHFFQLFLRAGDFTSCDGNVTVRQHVIDFHMRHIHFIEEIIAGGVRAGELRAVDQRTVATALLGIMNALKFSWFIDPESGPLHKKASLVLDFFFKGVESGNSISNK